MAKPKKTSKPQAKKQTVLPFNAFLDPPMGYEDDPPDPETTNMEGAIGNAIKRLTANDVTAIVKILAPHTRKIRWYRSRYEKLLGENRKLAAENEVLLQKLDQARRRAGLQNGSTSPLPSSAS